jgi:hypothetical protein
MAETDLRVQVVDDNIVVTLSRYRYSVAYYKAEGSPGLLVRYRAEFLAKARKLANARARELGWII